MVDLEHWGDYIRNIAELCDASPVLLPLRVVIEGYLVLNAEIFDALNMTEENRNYALRLLTGFTVSTRVNVNCYPRGETTTILFDLDGNEVS